ncbi:hypothetical protein BH24DEI2_BH24DEI2_03020 [soil metagenome]
MELEKFDSSRDIQDLLALRGDIERLVSTPAEADSGPKVDLLDLGTAYRLIVEVPGVPQQNLEIALQGRNLTVAGLRETGYATSGDLGDLTDDAAILLSERAAGHFQRSVELPGEVDYDRSHASLYDGLLVLELPKA